MAECDDSGSVKSSSEEGYEKECSPCENDGVVKRAKYFCTECQEYLCQSCESLHKRFRGTKNHTVSLCADTKNDAKDEDCCSLSCSCQRKDVEIYCKHHNEAFCSDYKTINHRLCKTKSIDAVISEQEADFDIKTLGLANEVKCAIEKLVTDRKQTLEQLNADTDHVKEEILTLGNKLRNRIDTLQENALTDLKTYSVRHNEIVEHHLMACDTALKTLSVGENEYQKLTASQNKHKRFLSHLKLTQTLNDLNVLTLDIKTDAFEPNLSFDGNQHLSNILNIDAFGTINRNFNADMAIRSSRRVNIKLSSDEDVPWITSSVFLPSGDIILCDRYNKCVKHFNSEFLLVECVNLTGEPRGCCLMNDNELLVSLSNTKQIQMFETVPSVQLQDTINLDIQCEDIDALDQDIYVICRDTHNKEIRIINKEGSMKRKIVINENHHQGDVFRPFYITVSALGDIFVSETNDKDGAKSGQIRCFRNNGSLRYTVSTKDTNGAGGMFLDEVGRLLACFWRSNSVLLISEDGTTCDNYFGSDTDQLKQPYSISFRKSDATLIVTFRDNNEMLVYKLE